MARKRREPGRGEPKQEVPPAGWWWFLLLYLGLGAAGGLVWARLTDLPRLPSWHLEMIAGAAPAPNQYRPLTPWLAESLRYLMPGGSLVGAYFTVRALATGLALFCFDRYLRVWFSPAGAAAAALCLAAIIPFTYFRVVQESDPINLLVFILAFWALARRRDLALVPLVALGALNRETVAMIPAVYLLVRWGEERTSRLAWRTLAIGAAWALVYGGLLMAYGRREYYCDVVMLAFNFSSPLPTLNAVLLFGVLWVLAFLAGRQGPPMLRRALWLVPPYLLLHYIVAMVYEARLFLPLAPILIPLAWWLLFPEARRPGPQTRG